MMQTNAPRVLVVDDERPIRRFLRVSLSNEYAVTEAENGEDALKKAAMERPDLIVLDLGLPDMDGLDVTRRLREWSSVPVIVISVRDYDGDKVAALDAGADDYVTKPFSTAELMARMRAALRHCARAEESPIFLDGDLAVDIARREVKVDGQVVTLTPTEYDILRLLVAYSGRVLTHQQLIRAVWGGKNDGNPHLLRANVYNLRKKIEKDPVRPHHIMTEMGVGYRLKEPEPRA